MTVIN